MGFFNCTSGHNMIDHYDVNFFGNFTKYGNASFSNLCAAPQLKEVLKGEQNYFRENRKTTTDFLQFILLQW